MQLLLWSIFRTLGNSLRGLQKRIGKWKQCGRLHAEKRQVVQYMKIYNLLVDKGHLTIWPFDQAALLFIRQFDKLAAYLKYSCVTVRDNLTNSILPWLTERQTVMWVIDWVIWLLVGWLTGWLTDWLTDRPTDRPTDWHANWLTGWLDDWLAGWLSGWLTDRLTDWLTDWTDWLTDSLSG